MTAVRLALESVGVVQKWMPEHEIRYQVTAMHGVERAKARLIPDGIMGVNWQGVKESLAIELELHGKNSRRYRHNFYEYKTKANILGVWYLTSTPSLAKQIEKLWYLNGRNGDRPIFFWSLVDDVIENPSHAFVYFAGKSVPLSNLWTPAHSPAQWMDNRNNHEEVNRAKVS